MRRSNGAWQWGWAIGLVIWVLGLFLGFGVTPIGAADNQYERANQASFNQVEHYARSATLPSDLYQPTGNWVGRLILPAGAAGADWVWLEVSHAPPEAQDLVGQRVRLEWSAAPIVQQYVAAVTRDVKFDAAIASSQRQGNLHPDRLNGRSAVGPLQSLAGAHPIDDVWVILDQATVRRDGGLRVQIDSDPVVQTGQFYALVKILGLAKSATPELIPADCPGDPPCASELFQVQHYNTVTQQFDGPIATMRIPQQPRDGSGVFVSTPRQLARSRAGNAGWYVYGAQDQAGLFTVQALKPRALFQLKPQRTITTVAAGLDYINAAHWQAIEQRGGTLETVLIDPQNHTRSTAWQLGQRAVVMHLFGGRGGQQGESPMLGTVTGHFSYGTAIVVQEPLAQELQWDLRYQQVYATNPDGVIAGANTWTAYMGDLRRGWLGTRPVSDILVKLDVIEDYDFGGVRIAPLTEFNQQLQVINARYRTGDGSGGAVVTPATSCVQDSNQALFATIQQVRQSVATNPTIQAWLKAHPQDPTTLRYRRLIQLGDRVERQLMPLGIVREDWRSNSEAMSGTQMRPPIFRRANATGTQTLLAALTSWRTILPRQTQDELSQLFLKQGAALWVLQTNQVGGDNPDILPIAPTPAFGRWAIPGTSIAGVAIVLTRLLGAINLPSWGDWAIGLAALVSYGAIALPLGQRQRFLRRQIWSIQTAAAPGLIFKLFLLPALVEELIFRVLLLPAPLITPWGIWSLWAIGGLMCFVAYHPLNALTGYKVAHRTFLDPRFLTLAALLGATCSVTYYLTSSLLLITLIHWVVVVVWLRQLGGWSQLHE